MRLLHSETLEFKEFLDETTIPPYAILSHTWGPDEVSYKEMRKSRDAAEEKEGFKKINFCANQAKADGYSYFWIDTACIDKRSSAELSEAINSMYRWYERSSVCYALLIDVAKDPRYWNLDYYSGYDEHHYMLRNCRWFTRGWTLQELLAPKQIIFFCQDLTVIGTRATLAYVIWQITGIPIGNLSKSAQEKPSVAEKMRWASSRVTTRVEDTAYCLLGLFDINMPLLYGEGERAFTRLQEEIFRSTNDLSIFAWADTRSSVSIHRGLFAAGPWEFSRALNVDCYESFNTQYQFVGGGIKIALFLVQSRTSRSENELEAFLPQDDGQLAFGFNLKRVAENKYARVDVNKLRHDCPTPDNENLQLSFCFIRHTPQVESIFDVDRVRSVVFNSTRTSGITFSISPAEHWWAGINEFSSGATSQPMMIRFSHPGIASDFVTVLVDVFAGLKNAVIVKTAQYEISEMSRFQDGFAVVVDESYLFKIHYRHRLFDSELKAVVNVDIVYLPEFEVKDNVLRNRAPNQTLIKDTTSVIQAELIYCRDSDGNWDVSHVIKLRMPPAG